MTEDIFRIAIVLGVGLACVAFVVQAGVAIALFRRLGKIQTSTAPVLEHAAPLLGKVEPLVEKFTLLLEKAAPAMEKAGPALERAGAAADQLKAVANTAGKVLDSANRVIDEARPQIVRLSGEMAEIAKAGHVQVDRLGNLLFEAGRNAQERLTQIDQSVSNTVQQMEDVSGAVKRAVMRPVLEVNGLAAGISAAVSTLMKGSRKSSVDTAVQDDEMFI